MKSNQFICLILMMGLVFVGCNRTPRSTDTGIGELERQYRSTPSDSVFQRLLQAIGKEIKSAGDTETREKWIAKALSVADKPEQENLRDVFMTESLKNTPLGPRAADYLWKIAERTAIQNRMDEASLLYLGFSRRYPEDTRNKEAETYIMASHRNTTSFLTALSHSITPSKEGVIDSLAVSQYIALSQAFALGFPSAPEAPELLYKSGGLASVGGNSGLAIQLYTWVSTYYPGHEKARESLMMKGFLLETTYGLTEEARQAYSQFIQRYPSDSLADDAKYLLENLGK